MRKGTSVIYDGIPHKVMEKRKNHVIIYIPEAELPELTIKAVSIKAVEVITK